MIFIKLLQDGNSIGFAQAISAKPPQRWMRREISHGSLSHVQTIKELVFNQPFDIQIWSQDEKESTNVWFPLEGPVTTSRPIGEPELSQEFKGVIPYGYHMAYIVGKSYIYEQIEWTWERWLEEKVK